MRGSCEYTKVDFDEDSVNIGCPLLVTDTEGITYQLNQCLGQGFEGEVWKVKMVHDLNPCFYRALKFEIGDVEIGEQLKCEFNVLSQLDHPSIIKPIKYWSGPTLDDNGVEQFHRGHMLSEFINGNRLDMSKLSFRQGYQILMKLISVIKYLNVTMKLSHSDLKPDNILITENEPVLVDFGFCRSIEDHPFIDRQYLGLIYLSLIRMNPDQIHKLKNNLNWYGIRKVIEKEVIVNALKFANLTTQQVDNFVKFMNGSDHDAIYEMIKKESQKFDDIENDRLILTQETIKMAETKSSTAYTLITKNLAEVIDPEKQIQSILEKNELLKIYWGTATTGKPHLGYLVPLIKLRDYLLAGAHVTILFADIHAILDNLKSTPEQIAHRTEFYRFIITTLLSQLFININRDIAQYSDQLRLINGSDFQKSPEYVMDVYKLLSLTSFKNAQHAGAEVVKQSKDPLLSSLSYPLLQSLDEQYLDVHIQFGGVDQRKIFMYARENLPKLGYRKRAYLMNPLIPGLTKTGKMSSSEPLSKIDFDDSDEIILEKIARAFSVDGQSEKNGLIAIIKYILFELYPQGLLVKREEKYGGDVFYSNYDQFEKEFVEKRIGSVDLKPTIAKLLIDWIRPIREEINKKADLIKLAYP